MTRWMLRVQSISISTSLGVFDTCAEGVMKSHYCVLLWGSTVGSVNVDVGTVTHLTKQSGSCVFPLAVSEHPVVDPPRVIWHSRGQRAMPSPPDSTTDQGCIGRRNKANLRKPKVISCE